MPTPVTNDPKTTVNPAQSGPIDSNNPVQQTPEVKDNLTTNPGLVVDPNLNPTILAGEMTEEVPVLATPEDFKKKKKTVSQESINFFELILSQQKNSLEMKRDSLEARQRGAAAMQKAQKENAQDYDKKVNEQAESQRKSAAKSGFLSIFSKVFTAITAVIGVAMLFIPGMQAFGVLMLVGAAVSIATQIPGVMEGLGKMFTAILTPLLGKELAEKWGPIVAAIYVAVVQIALAVSGPMTVSNIATGAMKAFAAVIKWTASVAGTVQGAVQGGVGIALGANNIDLAKITKSVDLLTSLNDLFGTQIQQYIETINQNYKQMTEDMRRSSQLVSDFPTFQVA